MKGQCIRRAHELEQWLSDDGELVINVRNEDKLRRALGDGPVWSVPGDQTRNRLGYKILIKDLPVGIDYDTIKEELEIVDGCPIMDAVVQCNANARSGTPQAFVTCQTEAQANCIFRAVWHWYVTRRLDDRTIDSWWCNVSWMQQLQY